MKVTPQLKQLLREWFDARAEYLTPCPKHYDTTYEVGYEFNGRTIKKENLNAKKKCTCYDSQRVFQFSEINLFKCVDLLINGEKQRKPVVKNGAAKRRIEKP